MTREQLNETLLYMMNLESWDEKLSYFESLKLSKEDADNLKLMIYDYLVELNKVEKGYPEITKKVEEFIAYHSNERILKQGIKNTYLDN